MYFHCPPNYYKHSKTMTCHRCHPTCKTCNDEGGLSCTTCYEGYRFLSGICESDCVIGSYTVSQASESDDTDPQCEPCDPSCLDCKGPGIWNCVVCPAPQFLVDDGRCLSCCGNEMALDEKPIPWECCNCTVSQDKCILSVNFEMKQAKELEAQKSAVNLFVTVAVLLIIAAGAGVFLFLQAQSKSLTVTSTLKTKPGGYKTVNTNGPVSSEATESTFGEYSDRIIDCEDEEENDSEDDIVYMSQDGTMYRKFKYGLLDQDDLDLEYDDESYSYG